VTNTLTKAPSSPGVGKGLSSLPRLLGELEVMRHRVLQQLHPPTPPKAAPVVEPDTRWNLSARDVMERTRCSRSWLYKNADKLPFACRFGGRLRFSERGLAKYIAERQRGAA
jgi:predicted DNA-binding transcriptional regulator AlpA